MKIINGYVCQTACDERAARQGKDPRNPHADPVKQQLLDEADALKGKPPKDHHRVEPVAELTAASVPGLGWLFDVTA